MSLLVYLIACGTGALLGLAVRPSSSAGRLVGPASLLVAFAAALFIGPTTEISIGDTGFRGSAYSGFFLACAAGSGLLLCAVALASDWRDDFVPATLATLAGVAVAITATSSFVALGAGAAAMSAGALVIARTTPSSPEEDGRLAEMRTVGLVTAGLLLAATALLRPAWNASGDGPVFVLAYAGLGLALAVRSGAVPFHVPAARLRRSAAPLAPAVLLVWLPAGLGLLAVSWSATTFGVKSDWLNLAVAAVQTIAVATLVLGALAALVHDEIEEVAAYSIVADAGFILLALAARTEAAAEPARMWLLVFVAAKAGLVAWSGAVARAYGTSTVARLRGWLRRTPLLGLALVVIAFATLGWPGGAVYEAKATLIRLALPGQLQFLFAGSIVLSLAYYGRLLVVGVLSPSEEVRAARSERPVLPGRRSPPKKSPPRPETDSAAEGAPTDGTVEGAATVEGATSAEAVAPASEVKAAPARTKRSESRAAARAANPTATAEVAVAAPVDGSNTGGGEVAAAFGDDDLNATGRAVTAPLPGGGPAVAWRQNRTLEVSLIVVAGAALGAVLAFGGLGASGASKAGIPLDTAARATPAPLVVPTPASTASPQPTLAPRPTIAPSGAGSSGSAGPSGSSAPSGSSGPLNSSAPGRPDTN